jgi:SNF2 family DNA or RNA helicase
MAAFASTPSNYAFLQKLRKAKKASLKPCQFLKPTTILRDYQVIGALHLLSLSRMVLGDGVGLGKTLQMITSFAYRRMTEPNLKLLVVTPKSAMQQWKEEFENFCIGITVHVLTNEFGEVRCKNPDTNKMESKEEYGTIEDLTAAGQQCRIIRGFAARRAQYLSVKADVLVVNYYAVKEDYIFLCNASAILGTACNKNFSKLTRKPENRSRVYIWYSSIAKRRADNVSFEKGYCLTVN